MEDTGTLEQVRLSIEGMECAACALRLERQLNRPDSVSSATVNYATNEATVCFNPTISSVSDLTAIVEKTGFSVGHPADKGTSPPEGEHYTRTKHRFLFAAAFTLPVFFLSMFPGVLSVPYKEWVLLLLSAPVVLGAGAPFFVDAFKVLKAGSANMNTLISLGVGVSFGYSLVATIAPALVTGGEGLAHVYFEAAAVITTLVLLGRMLEAKARSRTDTALRQLIDLQPDVATVLREGQETEIPVAHVQLGDRVLLRPGSRVPVDGTVIDGETDIDESMLTGEPMPVTKTRGAGVSSGTVNLTGSITFEATRIGKDTALQRIIRLVKDAQGQKPPIQRLADQISAVFVPTVLVLAILTFVIWLVFGPSPPLRFALLTGVSVLIIACPCALGLATPTAVLVGVGRAARAGVFVKGGAALERLSKVDTVVLDKTGTITRGAPEVVSFEADGLDEVTLLSAVASLERRSEHPIGKAIVEYAGSRGIGLLEPERFAAHVGGGVSGVVDGMQIAVGNAVFLESAVLNGDKILDAGLRSVDPGHSSVYVSIDGRLRGRLRITDSIRETSREAVQRLHAMGIQVVMATGDVEETAKHVGSVVGIDDVRGSLTPEGKVAVVAELQEGGREVAVVGDGINDAPALAKADVGMAIGTGTDVALETAEVALVRDDLQSVVDAIETARDTMHVIRQNLFFAFVYNVIGIPVAAGILYPAFGLLLSPMIAAGAMAMSSVSVVANSLRLKRSR